MFTYFYQFDGACIGISENNNAITRVFFQNTAYNNKCNNKYKITDMSACGQTVETELIRKAACQLDEYFSGKRKIFDLPILLQGTPFSKKVYEALQEIPYGQTRSYGQIARQVGSPLSARAVGNANNKNPIAIIVPCHRVVGASGGLVGYAFGLDMKKQLLELESGVSQKESQCQ